MQALHELEKINITEEIQAHKDLRAFSEKQGQISNLQLLAARCVSDQQREGKNIEKLKKEVDTLESHTCHTCGQAFHDNKHEQVLESKKKDLSTAEASLDEFVRSMADIETSIANLGVLGKQPKTFYDNEEDSIQHRSTLSNLEQQITTKSAEVDPYREQIEEMQGQALQLVTYDTINELTRLQEHQDFLLKLLTSKDSFIRKKIIEQNLSYLNSRLTHYLDRIGLPHTVVFQNDLTVTIEELGRELDFYNLSRGEMTRLTLSLSWAFRDTFESLYGSINLLFIDELLDNGLDTQGTENALALLKHMARERNKSVWFVSHKDDLAGRVENILRVVKENGFTSYATDVDIS
jgi:hypothetical protein